MNKRLRKLAYWQAKAKIDETELEILHFTTLKYEILLHGWFLPSTEDLIS